MWVKIDDGFCTHPKLLTAGPLATLIQLRAICYSSQNQTDGFFPASAVALFLTGFDRLGIDDGKVGDYATFGYQADEIDWPAEMVKHGLWEPRDGGYYIHDYLKWNLSKKDRELFVKKKSAAGKKGMKSRWTKEKRIITPVITSAITDDITKPYHPISTSTLTPNLNLQSNSETEEFDKFWAAYPRKVGKKDARKAWDRAKDRPALPEILSAITRASQSKDWTKDNGDYIPHPATWLNQGRWDDDHTPTLTLTLNPHRPTKVVL